MLFVSAQFTCIRATKVAHLLILKSNDLARLLWPLAVQVCKGLHTSRTAKQKFVPSLTYDMASHFGELAATLEKLA